MALNHKLRNKMGEEAHVGDMRFTMLGQPTLAVLPSLAGIPCWYCSSPITPGEHYYAVALWHRGLYSHSRLVHAEHADVVNLVVA